MNQMTYLQYNTALDLLLQTLRFFVEPLQYNKERNITVFRSYQHHKNEQGTHLSMIFPLQQNHSPKIKPHHPKQSSHVYLLHSLPLPLSLHSTHTLH